MDYHLRPLGKTCAGTGQPLAPGARCVSAVVERDGQLVRLDFSEEAWKGPPDGAVGHWKTQVPEAVKARVLDAESMMRSFEQMSEEASPASEKFRYVLSLLLLQKRKLQITGNREEDGVSYIEVTGTHGEGPWELRDHQLPEEEIEQLQLALSEVVGAGEE